MSRPGPIAIAQPADADALVSLVVSGGRAPYFAAWVDNYRPGELLDPAISSSGVLRATVKANIAPGTYVLQVRDSAARPNLIDVHIVVGEEQTEAAAPPGGATVCREDPDVKKAQETVIAAGITAVDEDGDTATPDSALVADGCMGPITRAALKRYLVEKQGVLEAAVPNDDATLVKDVLDAA